MSSAILTWPVTWHSALWRRRLRLIKAWTCSAAGTTPAAMTPAASTDKPTTHANSAKQSLAASPMIAKAKVRGKWTSSKKFFESSLLLFFPSCRGLAHRKMLSYRRMPHRSLGRLLSADFLGDLFFFEGGRGIGRQMSHRRYTVIVRRRWAPPFVCCGTRQATPSCRAAAQRWWRCWICPTRPCFACFHFLEGTARQLSLIAAVCRRFRDVACDDSLWRAAFFRQARISASVSRLDLPDAVDVNTEAWRHMTQRFAATTVRITATINATSQ
ncbi:Morn repeat protein [Pandoravirus inopinatum]|uniref:Morn repeat protein n=1 Tax=Pandoravirus inopinatum TaxID=1605721 RepID=A0A0B5J9Q8_9VIRU|nr:Morn repeat protein [Pandoravirus inopinatum]AJF97616.1 Morn repeat protein [Pandoravirus inopinatum]